MAAIDRLAKRVEAGDRGAADELLRHARRAGELDLEQLAAVTLGEPAPLAAVAARRWSDGEATAAIDAPLGRDLAGLKIVRGHLGDAGLRHLERCPTLRALALSSWRDRPGSGRAQLPEASVGPDGFASWFASSAFASMQSLTCNGQPIGDAGLGALAASSHASALELLMLLSPGVSNAGLEALATAESLESLEILRLIDVPDVTAAGLGALVASTHLPRLRRLTISGARLGADGARALKRLALPALEVLVLDRCKLGDAAARILSEIDSLSQIQRLSLAGCGITKKGVAALTASDTLRDRITGLPGISGRARKQ